MAKICYFQLRYVIIYLNPVYWELFDTLWDYLKIVIEF